MFKHVFLIVILGSFGGLLFGLYNIFLEVEDNACRMTYMFGKPQFSRVKVYENSNFPNYGLYYYYEGNIHRDVKDLRLLGAAVIFIPGNAGSHKQVRSFASVAIRKGLDNDQHINMDYFTIDYNEELSALYGGYLEYQKKFLKMCIKTVVGLYKNAPKKNRKIVLIGHSMGGILAEAILEDEQTASFINTIIFISTPLSKPVINFDAKINQFYESITDILANNRSVVNMNVQQNFCCDYLKNTFEKPKTSLENILLISIGGGNRDLLVRAGLTSSPFSDIHAMSSSIPEVWLSCDHLSSVWCLQLVLVINRFLFRISWKSHDTGMSSFVEDKMARIQAASHYFVKPKSRQKLLDFDVRPSEVHDNSWHEDSKRVINKKFNNGIKRIYNQLINLEKFANYKKLYVEVMNTDEPDWLYGCVGQQIQSDKRICLNGTSLAHNIQTMPSKDGPRSIAMLDLDNIRKTYDWSHIVLRLTPTHKTVSFNIDIYDPAKRHLHVSTPRWFDFKNKVLINETMQGSLYYKVLVTNLEESFQGIKVDIEPIACLGNTYSVTAKICVPWARGFDRYKVLSENSKENSIYVNVPISSQPGYNTTKSPVVLEIFLDPVCRYRIGYQFSIADTFSRAIHEFYHWLPAHFTSIMFIVLKNQISKAHTVGESHKVVRPYTGFFQSISLYLITGCRLLKKLALPVKFLPVIDATEHSFFVSLFIHGVAISLSIIASFLTWMALCLHGNFFQSLALRLTKFRPSTSSTLVYVMSTLPISFGVLMISVAFSTCSGLALIFACIFYFILLSNAYKDYLENWMWETAVGVLKRTLRKENANATTDGNDEMTEQDTGTLAEIHESSNRAIKTKANEINVNKYDGLQNFSYHITLLILLCVLALLNVNITIAWAKNRGVLSFVDPSLWPTVTVLACLSLLWQLNAPNKLFGYQMVSIILYICASGCVIYCQEAVYRLNFIIAFAYVGLLATELFSILWKQYVKN